jgi:ABC-type sugar transport system substrate-binding protein
MDRRSFVRAAAGVISLGVAGGFLTACGSDDDDAASSGAPSGKDDVTFGFSHPFAEIPVVATIKQLVKGFGEDEGWKVLLDETQAGKLQDQLSTLDTWITQKVTAMNVAVNDPSAFEGTARRAIDAGIIFTTYGLPMDIASGGVLFPPELSGQVTAKATVEWINANDPTAEVLVLEWPPGGLPRKRTDIPQEEIKRKTKAKIVAVQGAAEQSKGLQVTEDVLQANPDVSVVVATNDDGALGAAEAFRKAGKNPASVFIVGQDGGKDALEALKDPKSFFKASAALDIQRLCEEVVGVTMRAIDSGWKPGTDQELIELAPTLVPQGDTALIDQFLKTYQ